MLARSSNRHWRNETSMVADTKYRYDSPQRAGNVPSYRRYFKWKKMPCVLDPGLPELETTDVESESFNATTLIDSDASAGNSPWLRMGEKESDLPASTITPSESVSMVNKIHLTVSPGRKVLVPGLGILKFLGFNSKPFKRQDKSQLNETSGYERKTFISHWLKHASADKKCLKRCSIEKLGLSSEFTTSALPACSGISGLPELESTCPNLPFRPLINVELNNNIIRDPHVSHHHSLHPFGTDQTSVTASPQIEAVELPVADDSHIKSVTCAELEADAPAVLSKPPLLSSSGFTADHVSRISWIHESVNSRNATKSTLELKVNTNLTPRTDCPSMQHLDAREARDLLSRGEELKSPIDIKTLSGKLSQPESSAIEEQDSIDENKDTETGSLSHKCQHCGVISDSPISGNFDPDKVAREVKRRPLPAKSCTEPSLSTSNEKAPEVVGELQTYVKPIEVIHSMHLDLAKLSISPPPSSTIDHDTTTASSSPDSLPSSIGFSPVSPSASSAPTSAPVSPIPASPSQSTASVYDEDEDQDSLQQIFADVDNTLLPEIFEKFSAINRAQLEHRMLNFVCGANGNDNTSASGGKSDDNSKSNGNTHNGTSSNSDNTPRYRGQHRKRTRDDDEDAEQEDRDDRKRSRPPTLLTTTQQQKKKLACPFHKKNPDKFKVTPENKKFKSCSKGFIDAKHLKEHLDRKHTPPPYCERCNMVFKTEDERSKHARQDKPCSPYVDPEFAQIYIMQDSQRKQIFKRKRVNMTVEQYWHSVWSILFPGTAAPNSIYPDQTEFECIMERVMDECIPDFAKSHADPATEERKIRRITLAIYERIRDQLDDGSLSGFLKAASGSAELPPPSLDETNHNRSTDGMSATRLERLTTNWPQNSPDESRSTSFSNSPPQLDLSPGYNDTVGWLDDVDFNVDLNGELISGDLNSEIGGQLNQNHLYFPPLPHPVGQFNTEL